MRHYYVFFGLVVVVIVADIDSLGDQSLSAPVSESITYSVALELIYYFYTIKGFVTISI